MHFPAICRPKFQCFFFSAFHWTTPQSHWTKQTVKKLNLCGKMELCPSPPTPYWACNRHPDLPVTFSAVHSAFKRAAWQKISYFQTCERVIAGCDSISNHVKAKFQFGVQSIFFRSFLEYKGKKKLNLYNFSLALFLLNCWHDMPICYQILQ